MWQKKKTGGFVIEDNKLKPFINFHMVMYGYIIDEEYDAYFKF